LTVAGVADGCPSLGSGPMVRRDYDSTEIGGLNAAGRAERADSPKAYVRSGYGDAGRASAFPHPTSR